MKKIKVAHYVCFDKKFIPQQIGFLNNQFSSEVDQTFFVHGAPEDYLVNAPCNVVLVNKKSLYKLLIAVHLADRVVFNGLFVNKIVVLFLFMPWVLRKAVWVPWGGDLYSRNKKQFSRKATIFDWFKRLFVRSLYGICTPVKGDYKTAMHWYGGRAKHIDAGCNIFNFVRESLDLLNNDCKDSGTFSIQIGNSGDPSNEHFEIIKILSKYADENVEIVAPLAYGDKKYIETVIALGEETFGSKFRPLIKFVSPNEYNKYLSTIDVVVMNHRRQQGFVNLAISIYLGSKIFIRREVSTWSYLSSDMGCILNDTDDISNLDFVGFIRNESQDISVNHRAVGHLFDREWQKEKWKGLYFD